ncbi:MAG: hypothetical protein ACLGXA_08155 [Acidobacteriota bacterium]
MNDLSDGRPNPLIEAQEESLPAAVQRLTKTVHSLEERVSALEQHHPRRESLPLRTVVSGDVPAPMRAAISQDAGLFSLLGKAMLAIAGAYLLRALVQSGALPRAPLVSLAIAYAFFWLVPARRAKSGAASLAWAATSAIILLPMVWELTLRFATLPASLTAAVLAAYGLAAIGIAWKHHFTEVAWVTEIAASLAAVALAVATRSFPPFLIVLLLIAAAGEFAAARHRTLSVRLPVAAAADFALFAMIWIYSGPAASRAEYPPVSSALLLGFAPALLLIFAGSACVQTLLLDRRISFFEIVQTLVAFLLTVWTMLASWSGPGARLLGLVCLAGAGVGYILVFAGFDRAEIQRNYHVYATGSLGLLLVGCWLGLPEAWTPLALGGLAVAATVFGVRTAHRTLQFHGLSCLLVAAVASHLLTWAAQALAGSLPAPPTLTIFLVAAAALLCYFVVVRTADPAWSSRALKLLSAALALSAVAALLIRGLVRIVAGAAPGAQHIALLRTIAGCALVLLLAWSGSRWERREQVWLAWASVICLAGKLLIEDLRHGHLGFAAASIFVYAVTLLAMPRLIRPRPGTAHHP